MHATANLPVAKSSALFGCCVFAHIRKDKCKSLNLHTMPCLFLGYLEDYHSWELWDPCTKQVIISCNMIWNKEEMPGNATTPVLLVTDTLSRPRPVPLCLSAVL
jgi:hypothetical protein